MIGHGHKTGTACQAQGVLGPPNFDCRPVVSPKPGRVDALPSAHTSAQLQAIMQSWDAVKLERYLQDGRDWQAVERFYSHAVPGAVSLSHLGILSCRDSCKEATHLAVKPAWHLPPPPPSVSAGLEGYELKPVSTEGKPVPVPVPTEGKPVPVPVPGPVPKDRKPVLVPSLVRRKPEPVKAELELVTTEAESSAVRPEPEPESSRAVQNGSGEGHGAGEVRSLYELRLERRAGRDKRPRITYQVGLSYFGPAFCGWMEQPGGIPTVEGAVVSGIKSMMPQATARAAIASAGRTDKGVSALAQVFSFHTRADLTARQIADAVEQQAPPGVLRVTSVRRRPRAFHATFAAQWRRYVYLLPLRAGSGAGSGSLGPDPTQALPEAAGDINVELVSTMLAHLVGKTLDYTALARDTPVGKGCECTLRVASAKVVHIPSILSPIPGHQPGSESTSSGSSETQSQQGGGPGNVVPDSTRSGSTADPIDNDIVRSGSDDVRRGGTATQTLPSAEGFVLRPENLRSLNPEAGGVLYGSGAWDSTVGSCQEAAICSTSGSCQEAVRADTRGSCQEAGQSSTAGSCGEGTRALCIELVADRFLRRMVRILVATVVQLATDVDGQTTDETLATDPGSSGPPAVDALAASEGFPDHNGMDGVDGLDAAPSALGTSMRTGAELLELVLMKDRAMTARCPAPAVGLCLVGVGYDDVPAS